MPRAPARLQARDRILAAARKRFETFGYRRTGIAEIARDAGFAAGTLYRYFRNKEDLLLAVLREQNEEWLARARAVLERRGPAPERLVALATASAAWYGEKSLLNAVLARDPERIHPPVLETMHEQVLEQTVAMMAEVIRDGIREGSLRNVDPDVAAYVLFVAGNALFLESHRSYQDALPVYADIALNGLLRD